MKNTNKKFISLFNTLKNFFSFIKSIEYSPISKPPLCRIEEIDLIKKIIVIHCKGIDAPIRLTLEEMINDSAMLSNLSPIQASWIGYYYGKHYKGLISEKNSRNNTFNFDINNSLGKINILMLSRDGNLIYNNHENNITHTISPKNAMMNENIITQFTPMQACYIGILTGTATQKKTPSSNKTQLTVIK